MEFITVQTNPNPTNTTPAAAALAFPSTPPVPSRYESQKRRDWNTFCQYLLNHRPSPLSLSSCTGAQVLEFLRYLDQFGLSGRRGAASTPSSVASEPPTTNTAGSPSPTPSGRGWLGFSSARFAIFRPSPEGSATRRRGRGLSSRRYLHCNLPLLLIN